MNTLWSAFRGSFRANIEKNCPAKLFLQLFFFLLRAMAPDAFGRELAVLARVGLGARFGWFGKGFVAEEKKNDSGS